MSTCHLFLCSGMTETNLLFSDRTALRSTTSVSRRSFMSLFSSCVVSCTRCTVLGIPPSASHKLYSRHCLIFQWRPRKKFAIQSRHRSNQSPLCHLLWEIHEIPASSSLVALKIGHLQCLLCSILLRTHPPIPTKAIPFVHYLAIQNHCSLPLPHPSIHTLASRWIPRTRSELYVRGQH